MPRVVINRCYGGFCLSDKAAAKYCEVRSLDINGFSEHDICRDDPVLVEVVEELGDEASGNFAKLSIVDIPEDVQWYVDDYDGNEWVAERHRTWN